MGLSRTVSIVVFGSFLLGATGCGNESKSTTRRTMNPVCSGVGCLSTISWKFLLEGRSFPAKSRIDVNGTTVLNECVSKQKYFIDRSTSPEALVLPDFPMPKRGALAIDIMDLGDDCAQESMFFSDADVDFEFTKSGDSHEVLIVI